MRGGRHAFFSKTSSFTSVVINVTLSSDFFGQRQGRQKRNKLFLFGIILGHLSRSVNTDMLFGSATG